MVRVLTAVTVVALVLSACAGGDTSDGVVSQRIGPSGGTLTHAKGAALRVPSGALSSSLTFTVSEAPAGTPLPSGIVMGPVFVYGPEGATFSTPLTVSLPIELTRLPQGRSITDVVVMTAPAPGDAWTLLQTRIGDATHVEAQVSHFSLFVPVILSTAGGDGGADDAGTGFDGGDLDGGGFDGGTCSESCGAVSDGGADCACTQTCGQATVELLCSGTGPYGCACVENGRQTNFVTLSFCPGPGAVATYCNTNADGGVDGGPADGGFDGGVDGGPADAGFDGGVDGGPADAGFDGGIDGGPAPDGGSFDGGVDGGPAPDGGSFDGGIDGGPAPDGGSFDGGVDGGPAPDGGSFDGGIDGGPAPDGGSFDGGIDGGPAPDGGSADAGPDGGADAGTPDAGANDGG